jgi:hypothetical protein
MAAFRHSYQVASTAPDEYRQLASNAFGRMRDFASVDVLAKPLREFLDTLMPADLTPAEPATDAGQKP